MERTKNTNNGNLENWNKTLTPKPKKNIKFGDDYKSYIQKVPRMIFIVGLIRLLKRRKECLEVKEE